MNYEQVFAPVEVDGPNGLLAILLFREYTDGLGVKFLTDAQDPQQLAYIHYAQGHYVEQHVHNRRERMVDRTSEVLIIRKGMIQLGIYTTEGIHVKTRNLGAGDVAMLLDGGHCVRAMTEVEMVEIKQGPYLGKDKDKRSLKVRE